MPDPEHNLFYDVNEGIRLSVVKRKGKTGSNVLFQRGKISKIKRHKKYSTFDQNNKGLLFKF